jgi:hypothetical protein
MSFEETRSFFHDPHVLQRVKNAQQEYFLRLTQGKYDLAYVENRLGIGAIHERITSRSSPTSGCTTSTYAPYQTGSVKHTRTSQNADG